ncbi:MAG: hypothetical protein HY074_15685 [Deltaproteobacteria bacterium]|nr:hypothetical protein [Deltaproteobacteria bacterium]
MALVSLATSTGADNTAPWSHAEYGAGNYGGTSLIADSGIRNLRKRHPDQFRALFDQLDALVAAKGPRGVFFVNDVIAEHALYAVVKLAAYAQARQYTQVEIRSLPGDFTQIALPTVNTAHLRNPEPNFLINSPAEALQRLANSSEGGLDVTSYVAPRVWNRNKNSEAILDVTRTQESAPPYIYPDGTVIGPKQYVDGPHAVYNVRRKEKLPEPRAGTPLGRAFKPGEGCDWILRGVLSEARLGAGLKE